MQDNRELRSFDIELRDDTQDAPKICGYAAKYNQDSVDMGFIETLAQGVFEGRTSDDVVFLFNHDNNYVLARTTSGTLKLQADDVGLYFEAQLDTSDPDALRVLAKVRRGDINQCSFAFSVAEGGDRWFEENGILRRTITKISRLFDCSSVTHPAYESTNCFARSVSDAYLEARNGQPLSDEQAEVLRAANLETVIEATVDTVEDATDEVVEVNDTDVVVEDIIEEAPVEEVDSQESLKTLLQSIEDLIASEDNEIEGE